MQDMSWCSIIRHTSFYRNWSNKGSTRYNICMRWVLYLISKPCQIDPAVTSGLKVKVVTLPVVITSAIVFLTKSLVPFKVENL